MVRVFDREVAWQLPERSEGRAARLGELEPATEKLEAWRYSPIDDLDLAAYAGRALDPPERSAAEALLHRAGWAGGPLVVVGPQGLALAPEGVAVGEVAAVGERVSLVEEPFCELASLLAPRRVEVELAGEPVALLVGASGAEAAGFAWVRIRVPASGELWLVDGASDATLAAVLVELDVAEGASLSLHHLSLGARGSSRFVELAATLGPRAEMLLGEVSAEAGYHRTRVDVALAGEEAGCRIRSAFVAGTGETQEFRTFVVHEAPRTRSDLLYKGALLGSGTSVYSGLITITPSGPGSDAFQTNRNLLLSPDARAESVPNLDIQVSDVRCSHASTVGPLEEDLVFALEAKGIDPERAQRMLADGFFADVADLSEGERSLVRTALEERWQS